SMLQWMGGLGIILVFIVLLPAMGVTGKNLLSSEQVGVSSDSLRPRMQEQARGLFRVYLVLTLLALAAYWAITGSFFESVCHAFTTLSTGGFSPRDASIGEYDSVALEIAVIVFMFLAGANFTLLLATSRQRLFNPLVLLKNPEFRLYAALTVLLVLVVTAILIGSGKTLTYSLRQGTFAVVSLMTSTGYGAAADFQK
ncbi:MAG: hypothetical protein KC656_37250, partial [Myxococcales bacterium]|nr:hypothetical protein [Myxococcales bacterium]